MCVRCSQASENLEDQKDDSLERDSKQALPQQSCLSSLPQGTSLEGTPELLHLQTTVIEGRNTPASAHISLLSLLLDGLSQTSQPFEFSPASCVITGQPLLAKQIAVS